MKLYFIIIYKKKYKELKDLMSFIYIFKFLISLCNFFTAFKKSYLEQLNCLLVVAIYVLFNSFLFL